ncbi:MAG: 16S rRNA (cytosine(1402)-N(4))-methyltransferase RsmH [Elusimicrobia bacterium]|jgi:16S rRNA (cytosine1402-N4)-methyltransferase|nr:16S rRNA (cytosine(1402)-N(4))-methyltransferase RsmH [Elusimicrobiota bacterium]
MEEKTKYSHIPVMLEEVSDLLITDKSGIYVDATVGMGGHSLNMIKRLNKDARLVGIDWDPEMLDIAKNNLSDYLEQVKLISGNFADIDGILKKEGITLISGLLLDLGISSLHFDKASRGFSFNKEGPLDMRINPQNPITAYNIINSWPYEQIEHLIRICGEKFSRRITSAILDSRKRADIKTTTQLSKIIEDVIPFSERKRRASHPATKTFLALRVAVNYEFDNLTKVLQRSSQLLSAGGRIAVITFHSLEDRIVKETFKSMAVVGGWKIITKKPLIPSQSEVDSNPRARSAKLRVIEKLKEGL